MEFLLPKDFKELLESLNAHGVRYLLVGGYAVGLHGNPRTTNDIDIFVGADDENAERLVEALTDFGFGDASLKPELFTSPNNLVVIGVEPMSVDILNYLTGLNFDTAFQRRDVVVRQGVEISLIGLADLLKNKTATGRLKDLADVEELKKVNHRK